MQIDDTLLAQLTAFLAGEKLPGLATFICKALLEAGDEGMLYENLVETCKKSKPHYTAPRVSQLAGINGSLPGTVERFESYLPATWKLSWLAGSTCRKRRLRLTAVRKPLIALLGGDGSVLARPPLDLEPYWIAFDNWARANPEVAARHSFHRNHGSTVEVWQQFYERGRILCNVTRDSLDVLSEDVHRSGQTQLRLMRVHNPEVIITRGERNSVLNVAFVESLSRRLAGKPACKRYLELVRNQRLRGGIGTTYIRLDLYHKLGDPTANEELYLCLTVFGKGAELVIGLPNRQDRPDSSAVFLLDVRGRRFRRFESFSAPEHRHTTSGGADA